MDVPYREVSLQSNIIYFLRNYNVINFNYVLLYKHLCRYLCTLKSYVRNKSRPEGSIAEGYITDECLTFCSKYLHGIKTKFNRMHRYNDGTDNRTQKGLSVFAVSGCTSGKASPRELNPHEWIQAHMYVLKNCEEIQQYIE